MTAPYGYFVVYDVEEDLDYINYERELSELPPLNSVPENMIKVPRFARDYTIDLPQSDTAAS